MKDFRELRVWEKSHHLALGVYIFHSNSKSRPLKAER
jgi:hypothetical protein